MKLSRCIVKVSIPLGRNFWDAARFLWQFGGSL